VPNLQAPSLAMPSVPSLSLASPALTQPETSAPSPAIERQTSSSAPRDGAVPASRNRIEPLSAQRYKIQFTADLGLKQKLEQARDLLRHAHPGGDFAAIVSRALDLLIDDLLRRRFGVDARRKGPTLASTKPARTPSPTSASGAVTNTSATTEPARTAHASASVPGNAQPPASQAAHPVSASAPVPMTLPVANPMANPRPYVPRAARRAVLEREGLACTWVDAHGVRCGSQAWLEIDHRHPAGKGGSSEPGNLRLLCRAHNRFAAERAYGREHIEQRSKRRRPTERSLDPPA
jgi:hypothetical protein